MGFMDEYKTIYKNIRKFNPQMNRSECKALMTHVLNDYEMPKQYSEEEMLAIVNHMLYQAGKKLIKTPKVNSYYAIGGKEYAPGFIDLPDENQRRERREKSKAVRRAMIDVAEEQTLMLEEVTKTTGRNVKGFPDELIHMFRLPEPDASMEEQDRIREYNTEIADLFGSGKTFENKRNARIQKLMEERVIDRENAEYYLSRRRAQIVMDKVHSTMSDLDNLDAMLDPSLPASQLAENAKKIEHLQMTFIEIDNLIRRIPEDFTLTEEDRQLMDRMRRRRKACIKATEYMRTMASPVYEYLDAAMLQGLEDVSFYNGLKGKEKLPPMSDPWENDFEIYDPRAEAPHRPEGQPLDEDTKRYLNDVNDKNVEDMFFNILTEPNTRIVGLENALQDYGFTGLKGHNKHYFENFGDHPFNLEASDDAVDVLSNAPFAMEWNNRYGVFQYTSDGFQAVAPEALVNYGMHQKLDSLKDMANRVSVPNGAGREEFIRLKTTLNALQSDALVAAPDSEHRGMLGTKDEDGYFQTLVDDADRYLNSVSEMLTRVEGLMARPQGYNPTSREQRTLDRAKVARAAKTFGQTKIKELELLEKARATMNQYRGLSQEDRRKNIAIADQAWDTQEHSEHPERWLQDKIRAAYIGENGLRNGIPDNIRKALSDAVNELDKQSVHDMIEERPEYYVALVGYIIAAEQIMMEDSIIQRAPDNDHPSGILRETYKFAKNKEFLDLGADVLANQGRKDKKTNMTMPLLEEYAKTLDLKKLAADNLDERYRAEFEPVSPLQVRLEGRFVDRIHQARGNAPDAYDKAIKQFAENNLLTLKIDDRKNGDVEIPRDVARKLLADCAIISLIQKEREMRGMNPGHGTLESMMLRDPDSIDALRTHIMNDDSFTQLNDRFNAKNGGMSAANMIALLDENVPQQIADTLFRTAVNERNDHLYADILPELEKQGLKNPTFRRPDGEALDPAKPTDREYIVSGRAVYATEGETEVLFHAGTNLYNTNPSEAPFHAVNTAAVRNLQSAVAQIPGATITKAVGNPFSSVITPDKVLDLNTTEGMQYVEDGHPIIVSDGTNLTSYKYDAQNRSFNTYRTPYMEIAEALQANGFSRDLNEISLNKPDGSYIGADQLNDPTCRDFQYLTSGRPFYVTGNGGRQIKLSYRENENGRHFEAESTAHNSLMEYFSGNSEYNMTKAFQQIYEMSQRGIPFGKSAQYDALVDGVVTLVAIGETFHRELFTSPEFSQYLHELADNIAKAADTFLNGEGHMTAQLPRRKIAEYAKKAAQVLNQRLERENHERFIGKEVQDYYEIREENPAHTHIIPKEQATGRPAHDYLGVVDHRDELVTWLRGYQNYMSTLQKELENDAIDAEELEPAEVAKKLNFNPDKYTAADLTSAGIDGSVLTQDGKLEAFLKAEDDVRHQVANIDRGFTIMTQLDRRKMVTDWLKNRQNVLKEQQSGQASVREEFVQWIYATLPDFAKSLTDSKAGNSKVAERTDRFLRTLDIDPHVLDVYGYREYFVWKLDSEPDKQPEQAQQPEQVQQPEEVPAQQPEADGITALHVGWLIDPIDPDEYADANVREQMKEFLGRWNSNAQREAFLNSYLPGSWKKKMTDEAIAYRDFKNKRVLPYDLSTLLDQLDNSPMPRVAFGQLKLCANQYAGVLNSMDSLSKANIMELRAAADVLRVEAQKLGEEYYHNGEANVRTTVCPLLKQLADLESSQIMRLNNLDNTLHQVEDLTPEQQSIADRKYSVLKEQFEKQMLPLMERVDASELGFIDKVNLSKAVDNLRDYFDEVDSLTPLNCIKLYDASLAIDTALDRIGGEHEVLQELEQVTDALSNALSNVNDLIRWVNVPVEVQPDGKVAFASFRDNWRAKTDILLDTILTDADGKRIDIGYANMAVKSDYETAQEINSILNAEPDANTLKKLYLTAENQLSRLKGLDPMANASAKMVAFCNELLDLLPSVAAPAAPQEAVAEENQPDEPAYKVVIDANRDKVKEFTDILRGDNITGVYRELGLRLQSVAAEMEKPETRKDFDTLKLLVENVSDGLDDFTVEKDGATDQQKAFIANNKKFLEENGLSGLKPYLETLSQEIAKAEAVRDFKASYKDRYKQMTDGLRHVEGVPAVGNHDIIGVAMANALSLIGESLDALSDAQSVAALRNSIQIVNSAYETLKNTNNFNAPELEAFFRDMNEALNGLEVPVNQLPQPEVVEENLFENQDLEADLDNGINFERENRLDDNNQLEQPVGEQPVVEQPEQPVVEQPEQPAVEQPEQPVVEQPEQPVVEQPEQPAGEQPEQLVVEQPEQLVVEQPVVNPPAQRPIQANNEELNPAQQAVRMLRDTNNLYNSFINTRGLDDILRRMDANMPKRFESSRAVFTNARDAFAAHIQDLQHAPTLLELIRAQLRTIAQKENDDQENIVFDDNAIIELMQGSRLGRAYEQTKTYEKQEAVGAYKNGRHKNQQRIDAAHDAYRAIILHRLNMERVFTRINEVERLLRWNGIADRMDELCQAALDPNVRLEDIRYEAPAVQQNDAEPVADAAVPYAEFAERYAARAEALRDQLRDGHVEGSPEYQLSNMFDAAAQNLRTDNPTEQILEVLNQNYDAIQKHVNISNNMPEEVEQFLYDFTRDFMRVTVPQAAGVQQEAEAPQNGEIQQEAEAKQPKSFDELKADAEAILKKLNESGALLKNGVVFTNTLRNLINAIGGDTNKLTYELTMARGLAKSVNNVMETAPELTDFFAEMAAAIDAQKASEKAEDQKVEEKAEDQKVEEQNPKEAQNGDNVINVINDHSEQNELEKAEDQKVEEQNHEEAQNGDNVINVINDHSEQKGSEKDEDQKVEEQNPEEVKAEEINDNVINEDPVVNAAEQQAVERLRTLNNLYNSCIATDGLDNILSRMDANMPRKLDLSRKVFTDARNAFAAYVQSLQNPPALLDLIHAQQRTHEQKQNDRENIVFDDNNAIIEQIQRLEVGGDEQPKIRKNKTAVEGYALGQHKNKERIGATRDAWKKMFEHESGMKRVYRQICEIRDLLEENGIADRVDELCREALKPNVRLEDIRNEAAEVQQEVEVPQNVEVQQGEQHEEVKNENNDLNEQKPEGVQNVINDHSEQKGFEKAEDQKVEEKVEEKAEDQKVEEVQNGDNVINVINDHSEQNELEKAKDQKVEEKKHEEVQNVINDLSEQKPEEIKQEEPQDIPHAEFRNKFLTRIRKIEADVSGMSREDLKNYSTYMTETIQNMRSALESTNMTRDSLMDLLNLTFNCGQRIGRGRLTKDLNEFITDLLKGTQHELQQPEKKQPEPVKEAQNVINDLSEKKEPGKVKEQKAPEKVEDQKVEEAQNVINDLSEQKPEEIKQEEPQETPRAQLMNKYLKQVRELEAEMLRLSKKELKQYAPRMLSGIQSIRYALESTDLSDRSIYTVSELVSDVLNNQIKDQKVIKNMRNILLGMHPGIAMELYKAAQAKRAEAEKPQKTIPKIPEKQNPENVIVGNEKIAALRSKFLPRAEELKAEMDRMAVRQTGWYLENRYTADTVKDFVDGVLTDLRSENLTEDTLKDMKQHVQAQTAKIAEGEANQNEPRVGFPGLEDFLNDLSKGIEGALTTNRFFDAEEGPGQEKRNFEAKFQKKLNSDGTLSFDELKAYYQRKAKEHWTTMLNDVLIIRDYHSDEIDNYNRTEKLEQLAKKLMRDMESVATLDEVIQTLRTFVTDSETAIGVGYSLRNRLEKGDLDFIDQTREAIPKLEDAVLGKSVLSPEDTRNFRQAIDDFLSTMEGAKQMMQSNPDKPAATDMILMWMDQLAEVIKPMQRPTAANMDAWSKKLSQVNLITSKTNMQDDIAFCTDILGAQAKYLDEKMDSWKSFERKPKDPNVGNDAAFDGRKETEAFYKAADELLALQFPKENLVMKEIDEKLAELLAKNNKTRVYELCIEKKDDQSNKRLQKSETMKDLALYTTMKAALLNDYGRFQTGGLFVQASETLSAEEAAAKNGAKTKKGAEKFKEFISNNSIFKDKFQKLDNAGMYKFIVNSEYRTLAVDIIPTIYDSIKGLGKGVPKKLPKTNTKANERTNGKQKKPDKKLGKS